MSSNKVATMGLLVALAFILSYLESLLPIQLGILGAKLGIANIVTLIAITRYGWKEVGFLTCVRAVLTGLTFGSVYSIAYSLSGGILSAILMYFMYRMKKFSIISISVVGGVTHNVGQLLIAMLVLNSLDLKYYLGFLVACGILTGLLTGCICAIVIKSLKRV